MLVFHSLNNVFQKQEVLNFDEVQFISFVSFETFFWFFIWEIYAYVRSNTFSHFHLDVFILGFSSRTVIYFEGFFCLFVFCFCLFVFLYAVWGIRFFCFVLACGYPVLTAPFVEKTMAFLLWLFLSPCTETWLKGLFLFFFVVLLLLFFLLLTLMLLPFSRVEVGGNYIRVQKTRNLFIQQ